MSIDGVLILFAACRNNPSPAAAAAAEYTLFPFEHIAAYYLLALGARAERELIQCIKVMIMPPHTLCD
jgi:hypothetical protein